MELDALKTWVLAQYPAKDRPSCWIHGFVIPWRHKDLPVKVTVPGPFLLDEFFLLAPEPEFGALSDLRVRLDVDGRYLYWGSGAALAEGRPGPAAVPFTSVDRGSTFTLRVSANKAYRADVRVVGIGLRPSWEPL